MEKTKEEREVFDRIIRAVFQAEHDYQKELKEIANSDKPSEQKAQEYIDFIIDKI